MLHPDHRQKHMKRAVVEMGGKNGIIVDSSADLDRAVIDVVASAFGYSGQKCSACSRLIVMKDVYQDFKRMVVERSKALITDSAHLSETDVGPVINREAYEKIQKLTAQGVDQGEVLLPGDFTDSPGYYVKPWIVDMDENNILANEEVFGPVLGVMVANSFEHAMQLLNSTDYALTAGIHSRTPSHIAAFRDYAIAGNLYINRGITGAIVCRQPFGGFNMSGLGTKAGGLDYLKNFLHAVTVSEDTKRSAVVGGLDEYLGSF